MTFRSNGWMEENSLYALKMMPLKLMSKATVELNQPPLPKNLPGPCGRDIPSRFLARAGPALAMKPQPGKRQLWRGSGREHPLLSPDLESSGVREEGHLPTHPGGARLGLGSAQGWGQESDRPGSRNPAESLTRPEIWGQSLTSFESQLFQQTGKLIS